MTLGLAKRFLVMKSKAQSKEEKKMDKLSFIKTVTCSVKDTFKRKIRKIIEWNKIFAKYISYQTLAS